MEEKTKKYGKALTQDIERDIVIIGGGIAGVLTACKLAKAGAKVTIVEAENLFKGVTQFTTAHITANQGYVYTDLPFKKAKLYFELQQKAVQDYEKLIKENNIDCEFKKVSDNLFTTKQPRKLKKLFKILKKIGANVQYMPKGELLGIQTKGCITMANQAMFNPLAFLNGLDLSNIEIFENTRVIEVDIKQNIIHTKV